MSVSLENLEARTRNLLGDILQTTRDPFIYENSNVFTLTEQGAQEVSAVYINGVAVDTSLWSFNSATLQVTVDDTLAGGDTVFIDYSFYSRYIQDEIFAALKAALTHISINNYADWEVYDDGYIYPEPSAREQNLIATIASLIIDPDNKSYKLPDLAVSVPFDDPLPLKISKIIGRFKKNNVGEVGILDPLSEED